MLFWGRWSAGAVVMLAIWAYTIWIGLDIRTAVFLPAGVLAGVCVAFALSVPVLTSVAIVIAGLSMADAGAFALLHRCGEAFLAVGAMTAMWQGFIYVLSRRKIRREEAEYP
jgi:hypothetical protein